MLLDCLEVTFVVSFITAVHKLYLLIYLSIVLISFALLIAFISRVCHGTLSEAESVSDDTRKLFFSFFSCCANAIDFSTEPEEGCGGWGSERRQRTKQMSRRDERTETLLVIKDLKYCRELPPFVLSDEQ